MLMNPTYVDAYPAAGQRISALAERALFSELFALDRDLTTTTTTTLAPPTTNADPDTPTDPIETLDSLPASGQYTHSTCCCWLLTHLSLSRKNKTLWLPRLYSQLTLTDCFISSFRSPRPQRVGSR